jgi:hydroxymethylglutaryl-CoA reductase (NADPH)
MAVPKHIAEKIRARLLQGGTPDDVLQVLRPRPPREEPLPPHVPAGTDHTEHGLEKRRALLLKQGIVIEQLAGKGQEIPLSDLEGNIENHVGFARLPVGVIGPLRINGSEARGDFYVPMATTEGALVASYHRGANVISQAGGVSVMCTTESVARAPCFVFENMYESALFLAWAIPLYDSLQENVALTSRHCKLNEVRTVLFGKEVFLVFEYTTGDAAGQNMVTIATEAICKKLFDESPVKPKRWYIEGNMSGDKKATMLSFVYARGKKVIAEAIIPRRLVRRFLHVEPVDMARYWKTSILGGVQSGSIGVQGHFANALTAIFMACGQDVACVSEASIGMNYVDVTDNGDLYGFVALPNLIVGTVGGGTHLPTARECLEMIGCYGTGKARKFSEICCATALAGEISIAAAMAAGQFTQAHATYGRKRGRETREADK